MLSKNRILAVVGVLTFLALIAFSPIPKLLAQTALTVKNYAWSDGMGFIKADDFGSNSVAINPTSGKFSGYAWSDHFGLVNFAFDGADYVRFNPATTGDIVDITGRARACSIFSNGCSGSLKPIEQTGGWDGWINMETVKWNKKTGAFSGYAWSDLNTMWIDLAGLSTTAVSLGNVLTVQKVTPDATDVGTVTSAPIGVNFPATPSASFTKDASVILTSSVATCWTLDGVPKVSATAKIKTYTVVMGTSHTVGVGCQAPAGSDFTLTVTKDPLDNTGVVSVSPVNIGSSANYPLTSPVTLVTLVARNASGNIVNTCWTGAGMTTALNLLMDSNKNIVVGCKHIVTGGGDNTLIIKKNPNDINKIYVGVEVSSGEIGVDASYPFSSPVSKPFDAASGFKELTTSGFTLSGLTNGSEAYARIASSLYNGSYYAIHNTCFVTENCKYPRNVTGQYDVSCDFKDDNTPATVTVGCNTGGPGATTKTVHVIKNPSDPNTIYSKATISGASPNPIKGLPYDVSYLSSNPYPGAYIIAYGSLSPTDQYSTCWTRSGCVEDGVPLTDSKFAMCTVASGRDDATVTIGCGSGIDVTIKTGNTDGIIFNKTGGGSYPWSSSGFKVGITPSTATGVDLTFDWNGATSVSGTKTFPTDCAIGNGIKIIKNSISSSCANPTDATINSSGTYKLCFSNRCAGSNGFSRFIGNWTVPLMNAGADMGKNTTLYFSDAIQQ